MWGLRRQSGLLYFLLASAAAAETTANGPESVLAVGNQ
jgi:hypothetical protein